MSEPGLTPEEEEYLDKFSGVDLSDLPKAIEYQRQLAERRPKPLDLDTVARLLHITRDEVDRTVAAGDIYTLADHEDPTQRLAPQWQFVEGRLIPHLAQVLGAMEPEQPIMVEGFFEYAEVEDDRVYGVAEWLLAGGDPSRVVEIYREP